MVFRLCRSTSENMNIAILIFIIAFTKCCVAQDMDCDPGWTLAHGHCYSKQYDNLIEIFQQKCESFGGYVFVVNTKEELDALLAAGVLSMGSNFMPGQVTYDNGTTYENLDGSKEDTIVESWTRISQITGDDVPHHLECNPYVDCNVYENDTSDFTHCEKLPNLYAKPCELDMKLKKKLRRDATRRIIFANKEPQACYLEIKGRGFAPAQLKVFGYSFPMNGEECDSGFMIKANGSPLEKPIKGRMVTCGDMSGLGKNMIKKRSARRGVIRLYFLFNGDGNKVFIRVKGKSFM